jgi:gliding motility-associated-like protein
VGALCQDTLYREIYIPLDGASVLWAGPQEACYGDTVVMTATNQLEDYNSIINFTWSPNDLILSGQGTDSVAVLADSSVILSLYVLNDNGCEDTIFTPLDVIRINALFDSLNLVCNTTLTHTFNNTSINTNTDFLWVFDGTGGSNQINPTHTFPDTGLYAITLIAGYNSLCPDTFQLDFDLNLDGALITASDSQLVCRGDTVALYAYNQLSDYNEILYYDWSPDQNVIIGQGTDTVDALATADLDFIVSGTNDFGCTDTAIAHVNVTDLTPPLAIVAIPDSIFLGQTTQLYATNFQNYIYNWIPDSTLSALDIYNPLAAPRDDHTYYLYVTNDYCTAFDSVTVFIKDPICGNPVVFIPNAFSPDGDGFNDQLFVNGNNINELNLMVFNRWGQKVFETNDQSIGWDGSFNGQALAPDVYGYYLKCLCDDGGVLILKGNITLLR